MKNPNTVTHEKSAPRVRTNVRAGKITVNHSLRVRTKIRTGKIATNHGLRVRPA